MELALLLCAILGVDETVGASQGFLFGRLFDPLEKQRHAPWGWGGGDEGEVGWEPSWFPEAARQQAMRGAGAELIERAICVPLPCAAPNRILRQQRAGVVVRRRPAPFVTSRHLKRHLE